MAFNTPLILLAGQANAGKDTVGDFLASTYNAITVSLADPIKRFAKHVFEFTDDQLWGPSETRDVIDPRFNDTTVVGRVNVNYSALSNDWVDGVLPGLNGEDWDTAITLLDSWFNDVLKRAFEEGLSPRWVLQTLGTEWGRHLDGNIWVACATATARKLLIGGHTYSHRGGLSTSEKRAPDYVVIKDGRFRNEILAIREVNGDALRIVRPMATHDITVIVPTTTPNHQSEAELTGIPNHFFNDVITNDSGLTELFTKIAHHMLFTFGDQRGLITNPIRIKT